MLDVPGRIAVNLRDGRIRRSLALIALTSAVASSVLVALVIGGAMALDPGAWIESRVTWMPDWLADSVVFVVATLGAMALVWFTFVIIVQTVASLFLDGIVSRVEETDYPHLPPAKGTTVAEDVLASLRFVGWLLLVNLAATPLYLVAILIPGLSIIVFWIVNSLLFAREYAEIVSLRRLARRDSDAWRKRHRWRLLASGAVITAGMSVPLLNLAMPVMAAIAMTHLFHRKSDAAN
ncbi:MAG: EI24 domain-containing protein [bacterium]|nr:EI24 domain-containing protein [bacterium]